jgi:DNA primase RepB-like protein
MKGRTAANAVTVLHHHTPPSLHDMTMAESFLAALDPDADRFTFQLFSDGGGRYAEIIHADIHSLWPKVEELNVPEQQVGVFVTVNATDFKGRSRENIIRPRALFADADGEEQVRNCIEAIETSGARPSLIVRTSAHAAHFYWLCDELLPEAFGFYQQALIEKFGTDPAVKDLPRVMRLPGTLHLKQPARPQLVHLIKQGQHRHWKTDELVTKLSLPAFNGSPTPSNVVHLPSFEQRGTRDLKTGIDAEIDKIRSAVDAIPTSILASENDWVRIARGLAHQASISEPDAEKLWGILDEASRRSPNYDASENR